ncbi:MULTISPECIES: membrane protein insertase YidC [Staphylococcus]|uniref:Membrane protein insertase YidC n=1 Tax=Staphylococcus hsinchuensis TaxID=3051183 RepID=A0ABZ3EC86_9STAP|nr:MULTISPECIES: membrane protein insertase YidC [unclassified Staphylococcus]
MKNKYLYFLLLSPIFLAGCNYSSEESKNGFFGQTFIKPMEGLLHWFASIFNNNFGLAIIAIVLIVRFIMLPFMLAQAKNGQMMRKKMDIVKPEMDEVQEKVKRARTQDEKMAANQEMMEKYKEFDMNPMKTMLGCLPLLVQMPILFALYSILKWPSGDLKSHSHFLWFDLTQTDILMTIIAGLLYIVQPLVNLEQMPKEQKSMGYMMMVISPIFIIFVSLQSPSALALYWAVNAAFLVTQTYIANKIYSKVATEEAEKLRAKIDNKKKKNKGTRNKGKTISTKKK